MYHPSSRLAHPPWCPPPTLSPQGRNSPLESAQATVTMARAAELLKYTYRGWAASGVEGRYLAWIDKLVMRADTGVLYKLSWAPKP